MNPDASSPAQVTPPPPSEAPTRRNILTVQGCSGCSRPAKQRIKTPFGMRTIRNRIKMTRVPAAIAVAVETRHPRRAPVTRTYSVQAPFCKSCRSQAHDAAEFGTPASEATPLVGVPPVAA